MKEEREKWLERLTNEEKMKLVYMDFTVSEIKEIISELACPDNIREEAKLFFIDCMTIQAVADKMGIDYKTAKDHRHKISFALRKTLTKMFPYRP